MRQISRVSVCLFFVLVALSGCVSVENRSAAPVVDAFVSPADPPSSRYVIDARIGEGGNAIEGRETISLINTGAIPLGVVAFDWNIGALSTLDVALGKSKLFPPEGGSPAPQKGPIFVRLPKPLAPGAGVELDVTFSFKAGSSSGGTEYSSNAWYPRLW